MTTIGKNTVLLTTLAILAALGMVVRLFVIIPFIPGLVDLTPGFMFSELGGIVGGIPGGLIVGAIVGLGGTLTEIPILPIIGNMCLGLGTGIAIHIDRDRNSSRYALVAIIGAGIIGGFIPSMTIFGAITTSPELTIIYALVDMIQAIVWAFFAIIIDRTIIQRILGDYIYTDSEEAHKILELEEKQNERENSIN